MIKKWNIRLWLIYTIKKNFEKFNMKSAFDLSEIFKYAITKNQLTGVLVKEIFMKLGLIMVSRFSSYVKSKKHKEINL